MMDLPAGLGNLFEEELAKFEKEEHMPFITSVERSGIRKGLLKGIELGLELKFGEEGLKLLPEIREVYDHEKMEAILDAIKSVNSPEDLRQLWAEPTETNPGS